MKNNSFAGLKIVGVALTSILVSVVPVSIKADVSGDLGNFFTSLGYDGNVSHGHAYETQAAGYYTGGSAMLRDRVQNLQIIHIDAPSYRAGCGGIDLFAGGFSFVKSDQLVQFMKNIMSDSAGYAFNLALETSVPELAYTMQYIQGVAQKINNANINSCEMSQDLVGGLWPKVGAAQRKVCEDVGNQSNVFSDWAAARQQCSTQDGYNTSMGQVGKDEDTKSYQKEVVSNKNLMWAAYQQNGFLSGDTELSEFFMSLSGTYIFDQKGNATVLAPMADSKNLSKAILEGGTAEVYQCDESKLCLNPTIRQITIKSDSALTAQVRDILMSLVISVQQDKPLTDKQKGFLNATGLPVLKFIEVSLSLKMGSSALDLTRESSLIANDLMRQYYLQSLRVARADLSRADYPQELQEKLSNQIQSAIKSVMAQSSEQHDKLSDSLALVKNKQILEQMLSGQLAENFKDNANLSGVSA